MERNARGSLVPVTSCVTTGGKRWLDGRRQRVPEVVSPPLPPINKYPFHRRRRLRRLSPDVDFELSHDRAISATTKAASVRTQHNEEFDYVTAHCQLLINPHTDLTQVFRDPDAAVAWCDVLEVRCYQVEDIICPICLYPPVSPRMGPCGHIYCFPCAWYFIKYENETLSQKCAVCSTYLRISELKRVRIISSTIPQVGDVVELQLMRRYKSVTFPVHSNNEVTDKENVLPTSELASHFRSRIAVASNHDLRSIVNRDIDDIEAYLLECRSDGLSDCMIPVAEEILCLLQSERNALEDVEPMTDHAYTLELTDAELEKYFIYYKEVSGNDMYLHSVNWRCLQIEYGNEELPKAISGKVVEIESRTMNLELRQRYRYLSHLPLGRTFYLVEIDLGPPVISGKTLSEMSEALTMRQLRREEKKRVEKLLTLAKLEAENRIQSLPVGCRLVGHASLDNEVPTDEDFVPLSVATAGKKHSATSMPPQPPPPLPRSFACVSSSGAQAVVNKQRVANFPKMSACADRGSRPSCWLHLPSAKQPEGDPATAWPSLQSHVVPSSPHRPTRSVDSGVAQPAPHSIPQRSRRGRRRAQQTADLEKLAKSLSLITRSSD
uniref:E3 ubiquitin-protein ligase RNF10 n=1 Tax=Mesocestoides corti TaxID=53468 RepID=A0A5K3FVE5_MESCO